VLLTNVLVTAFKTRQNAVIEYGYSPSTNPSCMVSYTTSNDVVTVIITAVPQ